MCSDSFSRFYLPVISPQSNANVLNGIFQNLACVSLVGHEMILMTSDKDFIFNRIKGKKYQKYPTFSVVS